MRDLVAPPPARPQPSSTPLASASGVFRRALAVTVVAATASTSLSGQQTGLRIDQIGLQQGLSQSVVTAIVQDPTGFMWFGTQGGLNRYDGHEFLVLEHVIDDTTSLPDDYVKALLSDREGRLWVGTQSGGLSLVNEQHTAFTTYRHRGEDTSSLSSNSVYALAQDPQGDLLVGTFGGGLNRFRPATGRATVIPVVTVDQRPEADLVSALAVGPDGTVWVGTEGAGAYRLPPGADSLLAVPLARRSGDLPDNVRAVLVDTRGTVWLGMDDGLYRYDSSAGVFAAVSAQPSWTVGGGTIVTALLGIASGQIWIGTYGEGLHQYDQRTDRYAVAARSGPRDGVTDDRVYRLYEDRTGGQWISVWGGGINRVRGLSGLFALAAPDPGIPGSLSSGDITGILVDDRGRMIVGTFDGGLNIREPGSTDFRALRRGTGPNGLPSDQVAWLEPGRTGRLWVGFWDAGVAVIEGDRVVRRYTAGGEPGMLPDGRIRSILADREGSIWIGGLRGLFRFDPDAETFEPTRVRSEVFASYQTRDGMIWLGTLEGLVELDPATGDVRWFRANPNDPRAISHNVVADLFETESEVLWIALRGGGLNRVHRDAGETWFEAFTEDDGLADNDAVGVSGTDQVVWITSKNGLSRFEVASHTFTNFRESSGLPSADFNSRAIVKRGDSLYLGSGRGLIVSALGGGYVGSDTRSPVVLTALESAGGDVSFEGAPWNAAGVRLPFGGILSVQIAVLEFAETHHHRYEYRLGGPGGEWIDLRNRRSVSFAYLSPGTHTFMARGRNERGVVSETTPVEIEVIPQFWMTVWFRLLAILAAVLLATWIYRRRTAAILQHNEALRNSRERMRQLAAGIEGAREAERTRIAREIHDEFGQSLTSLKLDCQWLRRRIDGADGSPVTERLGAMMNLIDGTAREVRRIGAELRPSVLDNLGLAAATRWQGRQFRERTGIAVEFDVEEMTVDSERATALFRVLQEALTNVARHAGASQVRIILTSDEGAVTLVVEDNGEGIKRRPGSQSTFGLIGMQERVETWGGTLRVESTPERGTRIVASMPGRTPVATG